MKPFISSITVLVGLFVLTAVRPGAQPSPPPFVACSGGGLVYMDAFSGTTARPVYHCVDPGALMGKMGPAGPAGPQGMVGPPGPQGASSIFTGMACDPPGTTGVIIYTQLPDNSCLPHIAVPAVGGVAMNVQASWAEIAMDGSPVTHVENMFVDLVPAQ